MQRFYGFLTCDHSLSQSQKRMLTNSVRYDSESLTAEFENCFSAYIGNGESIAFASARMAFYQTLRSLNLTGNDEVILLGSTCAVMANAVLRAGAKVVLSDVSEETLGSCPSSISKLLTANTKVVVAQHSFGLPCDITALKNLCATENLFLIEDCALTFGTTLQNRALGDFGDVAIFSTDHTKPINTFCGGVAYSKNSDVISKIRELNVQCPPIPIPMQEQMLDWYFFEMYNSSPKRYAYINWKSRAKRLYGKFTFKKYPFLDKDNGVPVLKSGANHYPYPAKLPPFSAMLGLFQLDQWDKIKKTRQNNHSKMKMFASEHGLESPYPLRKNSRDRSICPLRLVFLRANDSSLLNKFGRLIDTDAIWFKEPLVGANEDLYRALKTSVHPSSLMQRIFNIPCAINEQNFEILLNDLRLALR